MPGRDYEFWLLDLDGTVVDIEQSYIHETVGKVGDRLGREFTDREAQQLWYGPGSRRERILSGSVDREQFWDTFHEVEDPIARAEAAYVYDDAARFVPDLTGPVGVVTHCQEHLTASVLSKLDIGDWFDAVVCCTDETGWKPDPEPVRQVMAELGVGHDGRAGAMAGDLPHDLQAASGAGLDPIHVSRRDHPWEHETLPEEQCVTELTNIGN